MPSMICSGKIEVRMNLSPGSRRKELVVGIVKHEEELDLLRQAGVKILRIRASFRRLLRNRHWSNRWGCVNNFSHFF
jgi:hypothetical protein